MLIKVYYQDEGLVVCEKPRGVVSQDSTKANMPALLAEQLNVEKVYTLHRLDVDTTGVMVYALNAEVRAQISKQIRDHQLAKEYMAVIEGMPEQPEGQYADLLFYDRARQKSYIVNRSRKGVKDALLDYKVVGTHNGNSCVEIKLHTGRTHQIRAQFASRKTPVLGDGRYGSKTKTFIHLHCCKIEFNYKGQHMCYTSQPEWEDEYI